MKNETLFAADNSLTMNDDVGSWSEEKYAQFRKLHTDTHKWHVKPLGFAKEPNLGDVICIEFSKRMESIGFLPTPLHEMRPIKLDQGNTSIIWLSTQSMRKLRTFGRRHRGLRRHSAP